MAAKHAAVEGKSSVAQEHTAESGVAACIFGVGRLRNKHQRVSRFSQDDRLAARDAVVASGPVHKLQIVPSPFSKSRAARICSGWSRAPGFLPQAVGQRKFPLDGEVGVRPTTGQVLP